MIKSRFIKDILDLLLDGDSGGENAKKQIIYLTDNEYTYTASGLYVYFLHDNEIEKYTMNKPDLVLNGITIKSEDLAIGAEAILFFKNGIIDCLEIASFDGNYPKTELKKYLLIQAWNGSQNKQINR